MNKTLLRFLITALIGLVLFGAVFAYQAQHYDINKDLVLLISNGAYVSGVVLLMSGLLCFVANGGGLTAFTYLTYRVRNRFKKNPEPIKGYLEYVIEHHGKKRIPLSNMFIVGGVLLVVAIITAIIVGK
jgi:hypothetical protein